MNSPHSDYHFNLTYKQKPYDFHLTETTHAESAAVVISGRSFTLSGDPAMTAFVIKRMEKLSSKTFDSVESFEAEVLKNKGSLQKIQHVAIEKLGDEDIRLKAAVEHGITPRLRQTGPCEKPVHILERMQELGVKGCSIAVVNNGKVWSQGYGELEPAGTLAQAASCSKSITALAVLSLIDEGLLDLDTDVSTLLPKDLWQQIDPENLTQKENHKMTIARLLSHTAGTTVSGFGGYEAGEEAKKPVNSEDIIRGTSANSEPVTVSYPPGVRFNYSGGGTQILQMVIEIVTKKPFKEAVQERVLDKLGMHDSFYEPDKARTVAAYQIDGKPVKGGSHYYPELAAAGLWSTAKDFAKVIQGVYQSLNGEKGAILSQELAQRMLTPTSPGVPNGLGVFVDKELPGSIVFSHGGATRGYRCVFIGNNQGQGVAVMTNSDNGEKLWKEIVLAVAKTYNWPEKECLLMAQPELKPGEVDPIPPDPKIWGEKYAGTYHLRHPVDKVVTNIWYEDGKLFGQIVEQTTNSEEPQEKPFQLFPLSDKVVCYRRFDPGPWDIIRITDDGSIDFEGDLWGKPQEEKTVGKYVSRDLKLLDARKYLVAEAYWEKYILQPTEKDHSELMKFLCNASEDPPAIEAKFKEATTGDTKDFNKFLACFDPLDTTQVFQINEAEKLHAIPEKKVIQTERPLSPEDIQDLKQYMKDIQFSGILSISDGTQIHTLRSDNIESDKTPFSIHSVGKMFTGVLALLLIQDGVLTEEQLDEPIALNQDAIDALKPEVKAHLPHVTLRQAMRHQGRFGDYTENYRLAIADAVQANTTPPVLTRPQDLLSFAEGKLVPEEELDVDHSKYSNLGMLLVGLSLEHLYNQKKGTKLTFNEILQLYIGQPADLKTLTSDMPPNAMFNKQDVAAPHIYGGPAGGFWSTAEDLMKFAQWLTKVKCGDPEFRSLMERNGGEFYPDPLDNQEIIHDGKGGMTGIEESSSSAHLSSFLGNHYTIAILSNEGYFSSDKLYGAIRENILGSNV